MFKKTAANSISEYIASVPDERREAIIILDEFIQKTAPTLTPHFAHNMLGYGSFPYVNYKKEEILWPVVALANQKNYISIYVCSIVDGQYIAESYKEKLGKVSVGKSCIRFKKLDDVNLAELKKLMQDAVKHPGLPKQGQQ